jgi:hypothetical protein
MCNFSPNLLGLHTYKEIYGHCGCDLCDARRGTSKPQLFKINWLSEGYILYRVAKIILSAPSHSGPGCYGGVLAAVGVLLRMARGLWLDMGEAGGK